MSYPNNKPRNLRFIVCIWLCLLMLGYALLSNLYAWLNLPTPKLLAFLPCIIYLVGGILACNWSITHLHSYNPSHKTPRLASISVLLLGITFIACGLAFSITGWQQLTR